MAVDTVFPSSLPCVSRIDGFGMISASAAIATPLEFGNPAQRRLHTLMPTSITLAWRASNAQLQPLVAWLNLYGYDWFKLTLAGLEASLADEFATPIDVRLMGDMQAVLMTFHRANWWTLSVPAEYTPTIEARTYTAPV